MLRWRWGGYEDDAYYVVHFTLVSSALAGEDAVAPLRKRVRRAVLSIPTLINVVRWPVTGGWAARGAVPHRATCCSVTSIVGVI